MEGMEAYAVLDKHFPRIEKYPLLPNTKTEIETNKKILETIQEIIGKDIIKTVEKLKLEQELKTLMDTEEI
jgi:hypothetical protein